MAPATSHFVFVGLPQWGHMRPLLSLALNLVSRFPSLHITFIASTALPIESEIIRFYGESKLSTNVKALYLGAASKDPGVQMGTLFQALPNALRKILELSENGEAWERRPTVIIADFFITPFDDLFFTITEDLRIDPSSIHAFSFSPTSTTAYFQLANKDGTFANLKQRAEDLVQQGVIPDSLSYLEKLSFAVTHFEGKLVTPPGGVPMYDYEHSPQYAPHPPPILESLASIRPRIQKMKGLILTSFHELEPLARDALEKDLNVPVVEVGPQFPERWWLHTAADTKEAPLLSKEDQAVVSFLDSSEKRFGKHSMLYISFGSVFFPTKRLDYLLALIKSLIASQTPFIFAIAGCPPDFAAELHKLLDDNDLALLSNFAPQMTILRHSATGWFLTHGGSNSTFEAVLTDTPLLFWPIAADQPAISSGFSQGLKAGIEFIQVRDGPSIGKPTARGITPTGKIEDAIAEFEDTWRRIRGEDGQAIRQNMHKIHEQAKASWKDGESWKVIESFRKYL